jgi:hypothetical protein
MTEPLESHLLGQVRGHQVHFWHEIRATAVTSRVPVDRCTVLDVGAGAGALADIVRRDRPMATYRFYEPLDRAAAAVEQRHPGARVRRVEDCRDADVVALLDVIEHVERPLEMLHPLIDSARPGTTIVITVPALPILWSSWDVALGHHRRYTKRSLRCVAEGLHLEVQELSYLFPELLPAALVRRCVRRRAPSAATAEFPVLPRWLDRLLFGISATTYRFRRWWPAGTSLVLVATKQREGS